MYPFKKQLLAYIVAGLTQVSCAQILGIEDLSPAANDAGLRDAGLTDGRPLFDAALPIELHRTIPMADKIDILFVVDDSDSMGEEQALLGTGLQNLFDRLQGPAGLPDLHIGIVSTNMGAHPNVPGCSPADSDDGALQFELQGNASACRDGSLSLNGYFVRDNRAADGTRDTNYTGDLTQVLSCMFQLGVGGCGFEHQLAAMRRAFENPLNAGFLRPDAMLAVVIVSDEDDCSAFDSDVFDPTVTGLDSPLGPLFSFRCFEFGIECTPDEPRALGQKDFCEPREESPFMYDVGEFVSFLNGLKADPQQILVAGIVGVNPANPTAPLEVEMTELGPSPAFGLKPACARTEMDDAGVPVVVSTASPAVRLRAFFDAFPGRNVVGTICDRDFSVPLANIGTLAARTLAHRWCLRHEVDRAPGVDGIQHACQVRELRYEEGSVVAEIPLAECSSDTPAADELPCWHLAAQSGRCPGDAPVEFVIQRNQAPADGSLVEIHCNPPEVVAPTDAGPVDAGPIDAGYGAPDTDGDGLPDDIERWAGTDPNDPDSDDDGLTDGRERDYATDPLNPDSDDDGLTDGEEDLIGTNPTDEGCENQNAEASRSKLPADIIIAFDNSTGMGQEVAAVEANINQYLAGVLEEDEIDYRIIVLADFPPTNALNGVVATDPNMCIGPPLAYNDCGNLGSQTKSNNRERFIQYDQPIGSDDALRTIIAEFDASGGGDVAPAQYPSGWGQHLREDSIRIFIIITDDETAGITIQQFKSQFIAKVATRFPYEPARSLPFIMHSILGIAAHPWRDAWLPDEGVQYAQCSPGSEHYGATYQQLSIDTGGLRFSLCSVNDTNPGNDNFDESFRAIAENVANDVIEPCTLAPHADQENLEFDGVKLTYRPMGSGQLELFQEVSGPENCGTINNGFYTIEGLPLPLFQLCPATCDRVSADPTGKINLIIDCNIQIG